MPLYYVETPHGCGIREAESKEGAWSELLKEEGTNNAYSIRKATQADIAWVKGMGGKIPNA